MGGGGLVGEGGALPPQLAFGVHGDVVHGGLLGHEVPLRHRGGAGGQDGGAVVGEVVVGGHPARQPPLVAVEGVLPEGDVVEEVPGGLAGGQVHVVAHDLPVQGGEHVAEDVGSVHGCPPYLSLAYSAGSTASSHWLPVPSPGTSTARCWKALSGAAPCQCFTLGGMFTTSPGWSSWAGLPHSW